MYAKIFRSMFDGSLATVGPWEAIVTFQQLLVLADRFGVVDMTAEAISRTTTIPLEVIRRGIEALEAPDPLSRDPREDGRRILRLADHRDWGWEIVNHEKYRQIRSAEERREYQRQWQQRYRAGEKQAKPKEEVKIPEWLDRAQFSAWIKVRPSRARTPAAQIAAIAKLDKFRNEGLDPNAIVRESLSNGWQGLFRPDNAPQQRDLSGIK